MFDTTEKDLARTLSEMHKVALERARWDQNEAKQKMREYLAYDGRFRDYDPDALIDRVMLCRSNGAVLDFSDPSSKDRNRAHWIARAGDRAKHRAP